MRIAFRRLGRLFRIGVHIGVGLVLAPIAWLSRHPERVANVWFRGLLNILNLRLSVTGAPAPGAVLLAGNHISWLDIMILASARPLYFVSKAEVARWPVIGWLAHAGGTLFIERGAHGTRELNEEIGRQLANGRAIVIFPEGTTTAGQGVRHFAARLFAGAISAQAPVQPFVLRYREDCVAYIDERTLFGTLWAMLAEPELVASVEFGPSRPPAETRKETARDVQGWVERRLAQAPVWAAAACAQGLLEPAA